MSLDDKLRGIVKLAQTGRGLTGPGHILTEDMTIAEIKQAFANEGYRQIFKGVDFDKKGRPVANDKLLFTGQEWYDRFLKETAGRVFPYRTDKEQALVVDVAGFFSDAARKAAGL